MGSKLNNLIVLLTTTMLMACATAEVAFGQRGYVSLRGSGAVGSFDTATNAIDTTTPGFSDPTDNVTSLSGDKVFVDDVDASRLRVIDTAANTLTTLNIGGGMFGVALSPDGTRVYACAYGDDKLVVLDAATNSVETEFAVTRPVSVAVSPNGDRVYVSNDTANQVEIREAATGNQIGLISGISNPRDILVTPDGSKLFVSDQNDFDIKVVSTSSNTVVGSIQGTDQVKQMAITPDGAKVYAAGLEAGSVTVIDARTNVAIDKVDVADATGAVVASAGDVVYASSGNSNTIHRISTATDEVIGSFPALAGPENLSLVPGRAPTARLSVSPAPAGSTTGFDASASSVEGATIARYDWDFGDGTTLDDGGPTPQHVYAKGGSYRVSVTVTSSDGVSTERVSNGTQVLRNGGAGARASADVTVQAAVLSLLPGKAIAVKGKRSLKVKVRSDLATQVTADAHIVRGGGRPLARVKPRQATATLRPNRSKVLRFALNKKGLRFVKGQLRRGKQLRLRVEATAQAGGSVATSSAKLKLPKRR